VVAKAAEAGGNVIMPPFDVMDAGRLVIIQDPGGAMFGLWQPGTHIGAQLVNMPNTLVWNELQTRDVEGARAFYGAALGWAYDADANGYVTCKQGDRAQAGMMKMDDSWGDVPPNWSIYFMVEDVEASVAKAQELGGAVLVPPTPAGELGKFSIIKDPQGAVFSLMQFDGPTSPPPGH
jgi:predicted enzyme related to lactoylglutathione lyase